MIANLHVATKYLEGLAIYNFDLDLKLFLLFFCSFLEYVRMITGVYKHMCVHMHVCEHMCTHICGGPRLTLGIFLHGFFTLSIEAESAKPRFADMASTTSQLALGKLSQPSWSGITGLLLHPPDIYVGSGALA